MSDDLKGILAKLEDTKLLLDSTLDALAIIQKDVENTRKQMICLMQDNLALSQRISKLEDRLRRE